MYYIIFVKLRMNATVEGAHRQISSQINSLQVIFDKLTNIQIDKSKLTQLYIEYTKFKTQYFVKVNPFITKYYDAKLIEDEYEAHSGYYQIVMTENVKGKLENFLNELERLSILNKITSINFNDYRKSSLVIGVQKCVFDKCDSCGNKMNTMPQQSLLICSNNNCGRMKNLLGTVFEDVHYYNQEGQRSKHTDYAPSKHFKSWMNRLMAREKPKITEDELLQIKNYFRIHASGTDLKKLTCEDYRECLKQENLTDFNGHIPYLRKIISGVSPPQLGTGIQMKLSYAFDKAKEAFKDVKEHGENNGPYYGYMLMKLIDMYIDDKVIKRKLFEGVHMQQGKTISKNDDRWEKICGAVHEFNGKFIPTDPNADIMLSF